MLCSELHVPESAFGLSGERDPLELVKASGALLVRLEADLYGVVVGFVNFVVTISSHSRYSRQVLGCGLSLANVIN